KQDFSNKSKITNNTNSTASNNGLFSLTTSDAHLVLNGFQISTENSSSTNPLFYISQPVTLNASHLDIINYNASSGALFNVTAVTSTINIKYSTFDNVTGNWAGLCHGANSTTRASYTFESCIFKKISISVAINRGIFLRANSINIINSIFTEIDHTRVTSIFSTITKTPTVVNNTVLMCGSSLDWGAGTIRNTYMDRIMSQGTKTYSAWPGATGGTNINTTDFANQLDENYKPIATSILINAGDNANIAEDAKDLAGNARIAASDADADAKVDIGAYEYVNFDYENSKPEIGTGENFQINVKPVVYDNANTYLYEVTVQEDNQSNFEPQTGVLIPSTNGKYLTEKILGLEKDINYQLRVAAVNAHEVIISNWSEAAKVVVTGAQDVKITHENGKFAWTVTSEDGVALYEVVDAN
ncbi:MAG: hypothetical protein ACRC37_05480, partial [Lentisphaeria bacterium]